MNTAFFETNEMILQLGAKLNAVRTKMREAKGFALELLEVESLILQQQQQTLVANLATMTF